MTFNKTKTALSKVKPSIVNVAGRYLGNLEILFGQGHKVREQDRRIKLLVREDVRN